MLSAYDLPQGSHESELTLVARGTPMGELLRRYWHPVGLAEDAAARPKLIRVLGEDLILFRDGTGRAGLLHPRCAHRGASLLYGRTEERGIRCCYHGWLFDVDGRCVEQPCEPNGGARTAANVRQPGYPVEELYGLIFAYMGPPEQRPLLPRYNVLEELEDGEWIEADDSSIGSGGPAIVPCNWLQHFENVMDPFHVPILHGTFSGTQFVEQMNVMPNVKFETTERGIRSTQLRDLGEGRVHRRLTEAVLPTIRAVANPRAPKDGPCTLLGWVVPIDDTSFRIYSAGRVTESGALKQIRSRMNGKLWHELTEEEHQIYPGDYEAQVSQGEITLHSDEHLVTSDRGIGMLRRLYRQQIAAMEAGTPPMGTRFAGDDDLVRLDAGTEVLTTENA
ncbi:aromatic ring-hydroxylating dioxygenase subunit alpha [Sphingomonas colocasiae]|uniref:Aromatic ring-hydroxylating dioxygenase subunit alpha n=1 Tax=Sphingomonas colocasiae TaxID=1848973 RepID=A0ABS7PM12_9SPHN|nr:aromatic ring-hydroxylating dioxygenase subunit alpha [Sphingomonas colocasiae]MBY8822355.1 aromatic ring-hydroxylating dioxygenase subunit alpha [Sphingomonas colocasiae]